MGSVVVGDFDFAGIAARPAETETPLVIDADAVLAGAFAFERFEPIAGRDPEVFKGVGTGKQVEFIDGVLDGTWNLAAKRREKTQKK